MPFIKVYFYKPAPSDPFWNKLVTTYDGPYSHCDVQFENKMASSIYMNEPLYFKQRKFSNPNYHPPVVLSIPDPNKYRNAYNLCHTRHKQQYQCDMIGQLTMAAGFPVPRENYTYCSKHCAEVLQEAGVPGLQNADASVITPSGLYRLLNNSRTVDLCQGSSLRLPFA